MEGSVLVGLTKLWWTCGLFTCVGRFTPPHTLSLSLSFPQFSISNTHTTRSLPKVISGGVLPTVASEREKGRKTCHFGKRHWRIKFMNNTDLAFFHFFHARCMYIATVKECAWCENKKRKCPTRSLTHTLYTPRLLSTTVCTAVLGDTAMMLSMWCVCVCVGVCSISMLCLFVCIPHCRNIFKLCMNATRIGWEMINTTVGMATHQCWYVPNGTHYKASL